MGSPQTVFRRNRARCFSVTDHPPGRIWFVEFIDFILYTLSDKSYAAVSAYWARPSLFPEGALRSLTLLHPPWAVAVLLSQGKAEQAHSVL